MPYIPQETRSEVWPMYEERLPKTPGELNWVLTTICLDYIDGQKDNPSHSKGLRYFTINEVVGALECCKLEFYRRLAAPYEDISIVKNGDVYSCRDVD